MARVNLPRPPAPPRVEPGARALGLQILTAGAALAPHLLRLPMELAGATAALLLWRFLLLLRHRPCPGALLRGSLAVLALAVILVRYQTIFGQTPGTSLLVVFTGLKMLETRSLRDAMF